MIIKKMAKILIKTIFILIVFIQSNISYASSIEFNEWLESFKTIALKEGVSKKTIDDALKEVRFLPKVIEYDRYQPEFYEDTYTYVSKRTNKEKVKKGINLYSQEKKLINDIENNFKVDKELLLALMGIETNFGKYLGKMDILSSLATLL